MNSFTEAFLCVEKELQHEAWFVCHIFERVCMSELRRNFARLRKLSVKLLSEMQVSSKRVSVETDMQMIRPMQGPTEVLPFFRKKGKSQRCPPIQGETL